VRRLATVTLALALAACASKDPEVPVGTSHKEHAPTSHEEVGAWAFDSLDARPVSADALRGKPTVLAFVTTDTLPSQAQVNFLLAMAKNDGDKVNYALVAVQPGRDRELVELYQRSLKIPFPNALAGPDAIDGRGPFGEIAGAPTIVVLDRAGRLAWKHTGIAKSGDIRAQLSGL
jgi:hypothetical protein